jgi:class 3 adenylate cyclase
VSTVRTVETYEVAEAAERTGVSVAALRRMVDLGILDLHGTDRFTAGHIRRINLVEALAAAGIPMDGLGAAIRRGQVTLDFLDAPAFERFSSASGVTFAEMAERTGVPIDLLLFIREAAGSGAPLPTDRIRNEELPFAAMIEGQVEAKFRPATIQQFMRAQGDAMRRLAETESAMWVSEVIAPAMAAGKRPDEVLGAEFGDRMSVLTEQAVVAMYHMQQTRAWTANIIEGLEAMLAGVGLHTRSDHPPAMCFLDIAGYTRLTEERGDAAAAELAEHLGRLVQRESVKHGGRAVKWLGDGVMLHFPNPGRGVLAALDMVDGVTEAGLPPAHVGLHAGPVIFQEGDYYGQTVNLAARIAAQAAPGEVLVSRAMVDVSGGVAVAYSEVGAVELKGVSGATQLYLAHRPH